MGDGEPHPAVARIIREHGADDVVEALGSQLSGADFTSLMLEVIRRRAAAVTPTDVLRQYQNDRFTRPSTLDPLTLYDMKLAALRAVAPTFVPIETSPLAPLGTHSAIAGVHQHRVVTTTRRTEVNADPTNSLALEAAVRRRKILVSAPRSAVRVHLASTARVVRAQQFDGPLSFAHFSLLGLVTAGRDTGHHAFETESIRQHIKALAAVAERLGYDRVRVDLTDFDEMHSAVIDAVQRDVAGETIAVRLDPLRAVGRGYYPHVCFKLSVMADEGPIEVADGGIVDWTQSLLGSEKERLMVSGLSLDRLAAIDPN